MAPLLSEANALLILTDGAGLVLDQIGHLRTHEAAREPPCPRQSLRRGRHRHERHRHGIGTALRSGRPTVVHASKHFCQGTKSWTCAAAPVRDPVDQRILGVVDLSGPPSIFRPHNTAMIATVAHVMEAAPAECQETRRTRLLEAFLDSGVARDKGDAVVILDRSGRVMYHRFPGGRPVAEAAGGLVIERQLMAFVGFDERYRNRERDAPPSPAQRCKPPPAGWGVQRRGASALRPGRDAGQRVAQPRPS